MPLLETKGAGSAQGFGLSLGGEEAVYIEDVFSTYLYTGNFSTQTITNNIDLSGEGGLLWIKNRTSAGSNILFDTARGADNLLQTNQTDAQFNSVGYMSTFNSNGFGLVSNYPTNTSGNSYVSWTFRKQPKFFDVVTYTGNGTAGRTVAHDLGSVPGMIIVKRTDTTSDWQVYHRSLANTEYLVLNTTDLVATGANRWNSTTPTSSVFSLGTSPNTNASGGAYVAYICAHDAGGFGLTGTDNVVSCGSYTGNNSATGPIVTLGYEPQWLMIKGAGTSSNWQIIDNMRGMPVGSADATLQANLSAAETSAEYVSPTATGFQITSTSPDVNGMSITYIYIAIRRGPMKVPTSGTEVFATNTETEVRSNSSNWTSLSGFPVDLFVNKKVLLTDGTRFIDRLRTYSLTSSNTDAEVAAVFAAFDTNNGVKMGPAGLSGSSTTYADYLFRRAPGFFDVVCYTGNGTNGRTITHNLGVTPELIIVKNRTTAGTDWPIRCSVALTTYKEAFLNLTNQTNFWNYIQNQSSTTFTVGNNQLVNYSAGDNYVAYLFATVAGVSKVGSYTGTGTTQTINCGFTAGARFVLIKRTDSTGDWYVWDSARGIVAGNDPYLLLNSTAAEVTSTDYVDTASTGFEISSTAPAAINANGGSFIFFAVA